MEDIDKKDRRSVATTDSEARDTVETPTEERAGAEEPVLGQKDEIEFLTEKWKRALADAENARKRADASRAEGREHAIAVAVEALAPALDALSLGIEAARTSPNADDPRIVSHLEGLRNIRTAFETGLKALGVRTIAPEDTPFVPALHEAMQTQETDKTKPGQVMVLHRPGFAIGQRLIRPARVTVSAAPGKPAEE